MASKLEIINAGLTIIGQDPITSLTDPDNETARKANRIYEIARKALLRKHFWNFAMDEASLALTVDVPALADFTTVFQLPTDYIRLEKTNLPQGSAYKIKGKTIYCNAATLAINYVYDCVDPTVYDATFTECLALHVAAMLTYAITTNATLAANVRTEAKDSLQQAKSIDSQEESIDKPITGSWISARRR